MSIANRLTKLEAAHRGNGLVVMWRYQSEPQSRAFERFLVEHPDSPDPAKADTQVTVLKFAEPPAEGPGQ
jgi:hypothetical protein